MTSCASTNGVQWPVQRIVLPVALAFCLAISALAIPFAGPSSQNTAKDMTVEGYTIETIPSLPSVRMISTIDLRPRLQRILQLRKTFGSAKLAKPLGLTFDQCRQHADCKPPHVCIGGNFDAACSGRAGCFCFAEKTQLCNSCDDCIGFPTVACGFDPTDEDATEGGICVSNTTVADGVLDDLGCNEFPDVTSIPDSDEDWEGDYNDGKPQPPGDVHTSPERGEGRKEATESQAGSTPKGGSSSDDDDDGGSGDSCIDARLMQHIPSSRRVYERHRLARVLCDGHDSCATGGHMVVHRGIPMMMKEYCQLADGGCVERTMLVNSPRFGRQLRVRSRTADLEFTAFAARFESNVERNALVLAIRVGL